MPRFDQTGPVGKGLQTGCRRGVCSQTATEHGQMKAFGDRFWFLNQEKDPQQMPGRGLGHRHRKGLNMKGYRNRFRGGQV